MASEDNCGPAHEAFAMEPDDASDMEMETEIAPSRCAYLVQPQTTIVNINERGDIVLLVGKFTCQIKANGDHVHTKAVGFRVCSNTLARASPVMKAMLFGKFWEASQTIIALPEDDPKAMELLLYLIHGDTDKLYKFGDPWKVSREVSDEWVDEVYQIVALADKYLMTRNLRPFAKDWCDALMKWDDYSSPTDLEIHHKRLEHLIVIAYQFGHLDFFQSVYPSLTWYTRRDQELFQHMVEPDGVADHLHSGRLRALNETLLFPLRNMVNALMTGTDPTGLYLCNLEDREDRLACQAHTLNVVIRNLKSLSLWPLPNAEDVIETNQSFTVRLLVCLWDNYASHRHCSTRKAFQCQYDAAIDEERRSHSIPPRSVLKAMALRAKMFYMGYWSMYDDYGVNNVLWLARRNELRLSPSTSPEHNARIQGIH